MQESGFKKLANTEEAAMYLNLKKQTLYNWRHKRKGPDYIMMGKLPMYKLSELDRFIESKRVKLSN
jgi:excisionase family DNA binding protein